MFSEGREDVNDEERAGRPSSSTTDEKINEVEKMILANRRITVREVAEDLNISIGSCHSIFINDLGMRWVAAKFVPNCSIATKKQHRMNIANDMLDSVCDDPNLLQRVITGDEAGVVHHEFLPQGRTVNKEYYLQVMRNLRAAIRQKRPDLWKNKNWLLHHDNAPAHTSLLVRDFLAKNNTLMMLRSHHIPQIWPPPANADDRSAPGGPSTSTSLPPAEDEIATLWFQFEDKNTGTKAKIKCRPHVHSKPNTLSVDWVPVHKKVELVCRILECYYGKDSVRTFTTASTCHLHVVQAMIIMMFHLGNTRESSQQFLTKSLLAFVLFNVLIYSLLATQLFLLHSSPLQVGNLFQAMIASALTVLVTTVFNGLYALLMLVVLTFFLIYGINMFVKLRGQFAEATGERLETDHWQVQQSRLGLVSLTVLLGGTAGLLACEGPLAQSPVPHRNAHQLAIRVAELAVAIWFPCALWNCACPAQLWLLNPRRLWRPLTAAPTGHGEGKALVAPPAGTECWICYDSQRTDAGPLIQPCRCRGDGGAVHHDCLRKWLVQSLRARCAVCGENYQLAGTKWRPAPAPWLRAVAVVLVTSATVGGCGLALRLLPSPGLRVLALGLAMVSLHLGLRLLGFSLLSALRRSRLASVRILHRPPSTTILDPTAPAAPMGEDLALTGTSGAHPCPSTL
ncbi:hypothetical protein LAZ67_7002479 [Cordylochernes scorpioides]|uniref:RING-CH-type domain-containing protein n=1 Tax=Cordylochernes scorpioides TaxID=51811 RepID=A0ABY6KT94_9ARAC|nr:hypothetical protein LAZ67_7002479 [Cordylochernes scorpioides]